MSKDYSELVNADRLRGSIRRLFENSVPEILGELLQNSQRALATQVTIETGSDWFSFADNGHGLEGIDGFHTLLKIGESYFDNPTIGDQDPMGLGTLALLAHDEVSEVSFLSNNLCVTIDTHIWWTNKEYAGNWHTRVENTPCPQGLQILVKCSNEVVKQVREALGKETYYSSHSHRRPARGYEDYLTITLDGKPVDTSPPGEAEVKDVFLEFEYQNCPVVVGLTSSIYRDNSSINWYGQIIWMNTPRPFKFHMKVRTGRPINPMSPSRRGVIEDQAYTAFYDILKDKIFEFVCDPTNRSEITTSLIAGLYQLDHTRASKECPYFTAGRAYMDGTMSLDSMEDTGKHKSLEIFEYCDQPLLIKESVNTFIAEEGDYSEHETGCGSFIESIEKVKGPVYYIGKGSSERLEILALWWKPGDHITEFMHELGKWGLGRGVAEPNEWHQVQGTAVYAISEGSSFDICENEWIVGCEDPMGFLKSRMPWAGFSPHDDDSEYNVSQQEDDYTDSIDALIRDLMGNAVPQQFRLHTLQQFFGNKESPIDTVKYFYEKNSPVAIDVTNQAGELVSLKIYS